MKITSTTHAAADPYPEHPGSADAAPQGQRAIRHPLEINKVGDVLDIVNCWSASGLHEKEARLLAMKCVDLILPVSDNIHMETVRRYINGQASKDELMKSMRSCRLA